MLERMNDSSSISSKRIRSAAVAGRFYPDNARELRTQIAELLANAQTPIGQAPKAIIAPHAGYIYSGPVAASAYRQLLSQSDTVTRVILIGPAHYESFAGVAMPSAEAFATPLGLVPVDRASLEILKKIPCVSVRDDAHAPEHSLEVHLPFLQMVLRQFAVVPLLTGEVAVDQLSRVLDELWGGDETRFVVSSDLSHYLDWETAHHVDQSTARAIESLDSARVGELQACGCIPIGGLLQAAGRHHLCGRTLDLRNSGDTAGPRGKVVGYGSFAFQNRDN
jgi:AmmeMemoRadiSam system protein B